ncbi:MAG: DegV family protein [Syntrophomonadaceae bacterium]|nr:DegV family protein [Syntrophomonadaceae bacterium]
MSVKVITDSTSYIDPTLQKELDITVIPLSVNFPDESFKETEVDYDYFYNKIETTGIIPTSSQPSPGDIYNRFKALVEEGHEIVAMFISSLMSGTYETALAVRDRILSEMPNANIAVLDSKTNCMSLGYPVIEAARTALNGSSLCQVSDLASSLSERMHFYFTPASLEYLLKGGRIGGAANLISHVLKIRPILFVDNGRTNVYRISRNFRGAVDEILKKVDKDYKNKGLRQVFVHHINYPEKAVEIAAKLKERYGMEAPILSIGPIIGLHVGPGAVGVVYCTES